LQLKAGLSKSLKQVSDPELPLCWKGQKALKSVFDVKKEFKSLSLSFANGKNAVMEIPPENYLVVTKNGNACLGILDGTAAKLSFNVIGGKESSPTVPSFETLIHCNFM